MIEMPPHSLPIAFSPPSPSWAVERGGGGSAVGGGGREDNYEVTLGKFWSASNPCHPMAKEQLPSDGKKRVWMAELSRMRS